MLFYFDFTTWRRLVWLAAHEGSPRHHFRLYFRLLVQIPLLTLFNALCFALDPLLFPGLRRCAARVRDRARAQWNHPDASSARRRRRAFQRLSVLGAVCAFGAAEEGCALAGLHRCTLARRQAGAMGGCAREEDLWPVEPHSRMGYRLPRKTISC